jgi:uncharacterized protein RhaS with RHS repeats
MLADPQRLNRYAYGLNNPYRYVDPDGESPVLALAIVGAVTSYLSKPDVANAPADSSSPTFESHGGASIVAGAVGGAGAGKVASGIAAMGAAKNQNPLNGTIYTDKVKRQMEGKDLDHNFPSIVDKQADAAKVTKITGGDGIARTKIELPGSINGKDGNYTWIVEPDKTINHRQFERLRK